MSGGLHVLSLGYGTELLRTDGKAANDSVNRKRSYARQVDSYTILVLARRKEGFTERKLDNLRVIPTNGRNLLHALWRMYRLGHQICNEGKINVIQVQEPNVTGLLGHVLKRRFGLPMNICVYGPNPFDAHWCNATLFNRFLAYWGRHILRHADGIVVDGSLTLDRLQSAGIAHERIRWKPVIPSNISSIATADGAPLRGRLLGSDFEQLLLFVGQMYGQKNVPFLLKTLLVIVAHSPTTRLIMVGTGRRLADYKKMARRLGVDGNILWVGSVPHPELPAYYKACDLLVLSSRFEGFPRVFMEAAAAGLPIITTNVSGSTDGVIHGESGFVVQQGDVEGYADRVVELLEDPDKAAAMGRRGPELIHELAARREQFDRMQIDAWKSVCGFSE